MNPHLYFITGVPGSGKSTIIEPLRAALGAGFAVHDFDEQGVPDNVDPSWAQQETKHWEQRAEVNAQQGITTVVCGFVFPTHISKSSEAVLVLLDLTAQDLTQRLLSRYADPKNITELARMTGKTPDEFIAEQIGSIPWLRGLTEQYGGATTVINTSGLTPAEVAQQVAASIQGRHV